MPGNIEWCSKDNLPLLLQAVSEFGPEPKCVPFLGPVSRVASESSEEKTVIAAGKAGQATGLLSGQARFTCDPKTPLLACVAKPDEVCIVDAETGNCDVPVGGIIDGWEKVAHGVIMGEGSIIDYAKHIVWE